MSPKTKQITAEVSYLARLALVLNVGHDLLYRVLGLLRVVCSAIVKVGNVVPVLDNLFRHKGHVDGEGVAAGSLPSSATTPAAADFVETTGRGRALVTAESKDKRSNVAGLECLDHLLGHDGGGHGSTGVGSNGVDEDVVLETLKSQGSGESKDTAFLWTIN